ncbi:hypothetical protein CYMTET_49379 [Cymbomonas tetramitiformis]|uniref:protein-ribulosamine 3-kinase n=1 Tax=Cymbomonas tetramitiformis TaxID=36881 RepID=A0AAE0BQ80_9CHLO|nr:hypothetical protein CYMTET_49379 [Cymbomonas tetramitiformis]
MPKPHATPLRRSPDDIAADWIQQNMGSGAVVRKQNAGYSDWASAYTFETENGSRYFVKISPGRDESMFAGEAEGLKAMFATQTLRIPEILHYGPLTGRGGSFIVMEHLTFGGRADPEEFGRQLALMHKAEPAVAEARNGQFGFSVDNTIGATPQPNGWMDNWVDFFRERRLAHQLRLARDSDLNKLGDKLLPKLDDFFSGFDPSFDAFTVV